MVRVCFFFFFHLSNFLHNNHFLKPIDNFVVGLNVLDDAQEKEEWVLTKIRSLVTRAGKKIAIAAATLLMHSCLTCCMDQT